MGEKTPHNDSRPRGILTEGDREFLRDTPEGTGEALGRQKRYRIRERIQNAFIDFSLIWGYLSDEDTDAIFEDPSTELIEGMTAALSFIYRGTSDGVEVAGLAPDSFEPMLKRAIKNSTFDPTGKTPNAGYIDVRFEHDSIAVYEALPQNIDIEEVGEKIEAGDVGELTHAQVLAFLQLYELGGGLDTDYPKRVRERNEALFGRGPLPTEEAEKRRKKYTDERFEDSERVREQKTKAEVEALLESDEEIVLDVLKQQGLLDNDEEQ